MNKITDISKDMINVSFDDIFSQAKEVGECRERVFCELTLAFKKLLPKISETLKDLDIPYLDVKMDAPLSVKQYADSDPNYKVWSEWEGSASIARYIFIITNNGFVTEGVWTRDDLSGDYEVTPVNNSKLTFDEVVFTKNHIVELIGATLRRLRDRIEGRQDANEKAQSLLDKIK